MGTFHRNRGPLHGITVVVETRGTETYVGRCNTSTDEGIVLWDAECHREGADETSRSDFLRRAARWGVWPRIGEVFIEAGNVRRIVPLGELIETA